MKARVLIPTICLLIAGGALSGVSFAQPALSGSCVVTEKRGSTEIVVSCPGGNRVINSGGRTDLYRVGDRIDIYGQAGNQPSALPGQTTTPGR